MKVNWRYVAEFIAVTSVVLSLIFVGFELRLSRASAEVQMSTTNNSNNLELRTLIAENAEVWYKGCRGDELLPVEQVVFTTLFHASYFDLMTRWSINNAGVVDRTVEGPARRFAVNLFRYPGYAKEFENHRNARRNPQTGQVGPVNLFNLIDSIFVELDESNVDMTVGVEYCGI